MPRDDDRAAIEGLIQRQFESLSWNENHQPGFEAFAADFHPDARLFPSARPSQSQIVGAFVQRMKALAETSLRRFDENVLGADIRVFGNIAVATIACEQIENGAAANLTVEMMLLVKSEGVWRIAAQAWDKSDAANPVPADLLAADRE